MVPFMVLTKSFKMFIKVELYLITSFEDRNSNEIPRNGLTLILKVIFFCLKNFVIILP